MHTMTEWLAIFSYYHHSKRKKIHADSLKPQMTICKLKFRTNCYLHLRKTKKRHGRHALEKNKRFTCTLNVFFTAVSVQVTYCRLLEKKTKGSLTAGYLHTYCIFYKSLHLRTIISY